jgi:hypothetical protein
VSKPPGTNCLKLRFCEPVSSFAFNFNLSRYTTVEYGARVAAVKCLEAVARACPLASAAPSRNQGNPLAAAADLAVTATEALLTHCCSSRLGGAEVGRCRLNR